MWAKFGIRNVPQKLRRQTVLRSATSQRRYLTYAAARARNLLVACRMCIEQIGRPVCQWNVGQVLQITK
jgi:response regulator of citrate/malate metabolism